MLENGQVKVHPAVYEFYKSFSETGLLGFALFYTLFGVISGHLADKYSRRNIIMAGITVWSAMTALCGGIKNTVSFSWCAWASARPRCRLRHIR